MKQTVKIYPAVILACLAAASCGSRTTEQTTVKEDPAVSVAIAVKENVVDDKTFPSSIQPWAKNNIAPQTAGRIEQLLVEVGDYVNAGQIIANMDDVQLKQAELQVNNDALEYDRLKSLHEQGGVSQSDFESFEMACNVHRSTYNNLLKNTVLRSPITGVVSARNYDKGDMYAMAQPLYVVEQIIPVKLLIAVSESDYNRVKKGDKATVTVEAFPSQEFQGTITNIYPTIDANTHTFNVEVKVPNLDRKLRPGMYARVNVTFGSADRIIVPDSAVVKQLGSGDRFVYILNEDNTVSYVKVELGRRLYDRYIILSGVNEGDKVVTEGHLRIKDGIKVQVK